MLTKLIVVIISQYIPKNNTVLYINYISERKNVGDTHTQKFMSRKLITWQCDKDTDSDYTIILIVLTILSNILFFFSWFIQL